MTVHFRRTLDELWAKGELFPEADQFLDRSGAMIPEKVIGEEAGFLFEAGRQDHLRDHTNF